MLLIMAILTQAQLGVRIERVTSIPVSQWRFGGGVANLRACGE